MDWTAKLKEIAQATAQAQEQAQSWAQRLIYLKGQRDLAADELQKAQAIPKLKEL